MSLTDYKCLTVQLVKVNRNFLLKQQTALIIVMQLQPREIMAENKKQPLQLLRPIKKTQRFIQVIHDCHRLPWKMDFVFYIHRQTMFSMGMAIFCASVILSFFWLICVQSVLSSVNSDGNSNE